MQLLFAASEVAPFRKTGGLADVVGSLPKELVKLGHDVRVIMPKYEHIPEHWVKQMKEVVSFRFYLGWRNVYCGLLELEHEGVRYYFVDNEHYFRRDGLYGYHDDAERFAFLSRSVLEVLPKISYKPDVIHCHDWQTAMICFLLKVYHGEDKNYAHIKSVLTVHNLRFQGTFPHYVLHDLFGLSDEYFTYDKVEHHGNMNFLKAGLTYADKITTVSPSYAYEIQQPYFGEGLHQLIRYRAQDVVGIVNGIDDKRFSPQLDRYIKENYQRSLKKKQVNKRDLQEQLGLIQDASVPIIGIVSRFDSQKGFDLIEGVFDQMMTTGVQVVVLGTGEHKYENFFQAMGYRYPQQVSTHIQFDEALASKIYAGSDLFLMPSRYEPCGIGQMIAMRYGTVPIVRETGGLKDTVISFDEHTKIGNGFSFANYNAHDMLHTIQRALHFYHDNEVWSDIVKQAFSSSFNWKKSAREYVSLYKNL